MTPPRHMLIPIAAAGLALGAGALAVPGAALAGNVLFTGTAGTASTGLMWTGFAGDGALAAGPGSALGTALSTSANHMVVTPDGATVIVADGHTLRTFPRNPDTGVVSAQVDQEIAGQINVSGLALTPSGTRLYMTTYDGGMNSTIEQLAVAADGTLTLLGQATTSTEMWGAPIVSPNGTSLYVMPLGGNPRVIRQYDIGPTGALTAKAAPTVATGNNSLAAPVFTGGGTTLVALVYTASGNAPVAFSIDPVTGALTPPGSLPSGVANSPAIMRVSPDGTFALVASGKTLRTLPIAQDGTPGALGATVNVVPTGIGTSTTSTTGFDLSPDGQWAYIAAVTRDFGSQLISPQPGPLSVPVAANGTFGNATQSDMRKDIPYAKLIVAPVRPSIAALSATAGQPGAITTLNAAASTSPDAPITSYRFTFGDGSPPATGASPTVTHTYATAGTYTATVTVANSAGCGTDGRFDGMRTICNGSAGATATTAVVVATAPPPASAPDPAPAADATPPATPAAPATPADPAASPVCAASATTTVRRGRVLERATVAERTCADGPQVRLSLPNAASRRACAITGAGAVRGVRPGRCTVRVATTAAGSTSVRTIVVIVR